MSLLSRAGYAQNENARNENATDRAGWAAVDLHTHSCLSDGEHPIGKVFAHGISNGLHLMANSDHGGTSERSYDCNAWKRSDGDLRGDDVWEDGRPAMWRWQSLLLASRRVEAQRLVTPRHSFVLGLEWNPPGVDHASVGIISDRAQPIASFEYKFDEDDLDTSGGPTGSLRKANGRKGGDGERLSSQKQRAHVLQALSWLQEHHPQTSYVLPNHPERSMRYTIEDFRAWNDAAPQVVFGFEGAPGHQKTTDRPRGYFRKGGARGGSTYGGFGIMAAQVGGVWDALLSEGRRFWLFGNSDFHHTRGDFWPGDYTKTWVRTRDTTSAQAILDGMRSGQVFVARGGLIDRLDFRLQKGRRQATMGDTLDARKGEGVEVLIRFRQSGAGNSPVEHIDVIKGQLTGRVSPRSLEYREATNETTRVIHQLSPDDWERKEKWHVARLTLSSLDHSSYLRIRGTSNPPGSSYQTDDLGNPQPDSLAEAHGITGAEEAQGDLWFYSNPVFIVVD